MHGNIKRLENGLLPSGSKEHGRKQNVRMHSVPDLMINVVVSIQTIKPALDTNLFHGREVVFSFDVDIFNDKNANIF